MRNAQPNSKCAECSCCSLVTETITGAPLNPYYQCLGDATDECLDGEPMTTYKINGYRGEILYTTEVDGKEVNILAENKAYVLAHWAKGGYDEFITWLKDMRGGFAWGHYYTAFADLTPEKAYKMAKKDYDERIRG